jgi:hypothetical protein
VPSLRPRGLAGNSFRFFGARDNKKRLFAAAFYKGEHMKRLSVIGISLVVLVALAGVARADAPAKQEGRVWYDQNLTLAFTPEWSFTVMPGVRTEFARSRENLAGVQFLEFFIGPNFTYKQGNLTLKGSLWYYYMGYPTLGRRTEQPAGSGILNCNLQLPGATNCQSTYVFSHNLEIIPAAEYRIGRWSIYDRVILHNTFYADVYNTDRTADLGLSVNDQRWGWGTVLRELVQGRYALTDRMGVLLADELFFGIIEDSDTKKLFKTNADGSHTATGYTPTGYWKDGLRYNRTYVGIDFKVTPTLTVAPMYMMEIGLSPVDSGDVTDIAHNLFVVVTYVAKMWEDKK